MIHIELIDQNDFIVEVDLDGFVYFLHFGWNSECQFWTLAIEDANSELVMSGICVMPNVDLLAQARTLRVPIGVLMAYSESGAALDRDSFVDGRAALIYAGVNDGTV